MTTRLSGRCTARMRDAPTGGTIALGGRLSDIGGPRLSTRVTGRSAQEGPPPG
ncbi:hypothetical protein HW130_16050 [Streptomyces sp. PKU-EA00015]|uniref:hypothetical protein n=1 Tax=Streptomyces sp. PKU-EA00015 TaxID=2748326 RepID=UPI0015A318E8|nr:hypothetical protein [Streptomyces sp. PKU-EA00015]NWF27758.1 hypothetical protein [Streptomyces sp. PKU-EA00015]